MRSVRAILLYAVAVIVLGALLAPWLFWAVQWMAEHVPVASGLARQPFKRVLNRSLMVVALLGLWPLWRGLGIRSWSQVGFVPDRRWWRPMLSAFVVGVLSLAVAVGLGVALGLRHLEFSATGADAAVLVGGLLLTAVVVGVIEETFFRGGLQGSLQRGLPVAVAWLVASLIYAALHFLKPKLPRLAPADVDWLSGIHALGTIVSSSLVRSDVVIAFGSLFLAGLILGWAYRRTGALYYPIGLHAGWVLANEWVRAQGGDAVVHDLLAWPVLLALWAGLAWCWRRPRADCPGAQQRGGDSP
ncbi:CPBP family intramembrane metalloprotease [bacterium]|nr:CPBP family intramembrane metalloprotease [bacterium]